MSNIGEGYNKVLQVNNTNITFLLEYSGKNDLPLKLVQL